MRVSRFVHSITIGWIIVEFCTGAHGPQRLKSTDFGVPLYFLRCHHEADMKNVGWIVLKFGPDDVPHRTNSNNFFIIISSKYYLQN